MNILSLQPYFGGSHQSFQKGWVKHSRHGWTVLTLPPRHWKWRMRHAAVHFAEQLDSYAVDFDCIFCTDFLNVAEFRGLVPDRIRRMPLIVYFHENQFAYPSRRYDERDLHFGFTNFTSCLAADQIWFNSRFNRDSFLTALVEACDKWPDYPPRDAIKSILPKCRIEPPGIELFEEVKSNAAISSGSGQPIRIVWAARWEHDKNPELLLNGLRAMERRGIDFRINVIGQSFRRVPEAFEQIQKQFESKIDRWGFQETAADYQAAIHESDLFLSTADHEFFGIAAAEAIASGLIPLLPDRLAYPELIDASFGSSRASAFLYDGSPDGLAARLEWIVRKRHHPAFQEMCKALRQETSDQFRWSQRASQMDEQIEAICAAVR